MTTHGSIDLSDFIAAAGLPELTPWQRHLIGSLPSGSITVDFSEPPRRSYWAAGLRPLIIPEFFDWLDREFHHRRRRRLSRIHTEYHRRHR